MTSKIYEDKEKVKKINTWIGNAIRRNLKSLNDVKQHLINNEGEQDNSATDTFSKVIMTVLQTKQQENKVVLRDGAFGKEIHVFFSATNIPIKCLTNDVLYMRMLLKKLIDATGLPDKTRTLIYDSNIVSMTVASKNFLLDQTTRAGFIQDYDSNFSSIFLKGTLSEQDLNVLVQNKPNTDDFYWDGTKYLYFGNNDLYVICPSDYSEKEILEKMESMVYLRSKKSTFALGEKKITPDNKVKFLYQDVKPNDFCPSYWFAPVDVSCDFLFEMSLNYNDLFEFVYEQDTNVCDWPPNLAYWDTLQQCFDFVAVLGLTGVGMPESLRKQIADWVDSYVYYKSEILKIRNVMQKIERVFHDFLNAFLNNSTFERYGNILKKAEEALEGSKEVVKIKYYSDAVAFLNQLPFCRMINNQFKGQVIEVLKEVIRILKNFFKGSKFDTIMVEIRTCAKQIMAFLPNVGKDDACYPFIVAGGGLTGELIIQSNQDQDPVSTRVNKQLKNQRKKTEKKKKEKEQAKNTMLDRDNIIREYVSFYINNRPKSKKKLTSLEERELMNIFLYWFNNITNDNMRGQILERAQTTVDTKKYKFDETLDAFATDLYALRHTRGKKVPKLHVFFKNALDGYNALNKVQTDTVNMTTNDTAMEVEEEDVKEEENK